MVDTISRIVVGCTAFNDKKLPILKKPESLKASLIELSEIKHLGKLNVRCGKKNRDALGKLIHCNLPIQINQINSKAGRFAISLGPDEYLILAEPGSENQLEKTLNSSIEVVDICTIVKKCNMDEISKYLLKMEKKKDFPDITTRQ